MSFAVAHRLALRPVVGLLAEDDAVDEARHLRHRGRPPERRHRGEIALQSLGEAHEVPHREGVVLHERHHPVQAV